MEYFRLLDDVHIAGRWHLGCIRDIASNEEPPLGSGLPVDRDLVLLAKITHAGIPLEFSLTSFAVPVLTTVLATAIQDLCPSDVQRLPLQIEGHEGFEMLNVLRTIPCLDETQCAFQKWTAQDHRSDLAGQYRMVIGLKIDSRQVPSDAHIFRVKDWEIALILSEHVKNLMENRGCHGAIFKRVTGSIDVG